jgi:signal peptidase I
VGLPGDEIDLRNNELYINGQHLTYSDLNDNIEKEQLGTHDHSVMLSPLIRAMRDYGPKKVPAGEYFMMGDNRDNSKDSRYIGFVPRGNIVGRSSRVIMSLNYDNYYLPRSERWFRALP